MRRRKTRRTVNKKRVGLLFGVIALVWMGISALHLTNPYLRSADFVEVSVAHGESVWSIAQTYSAKESTVKDLEEAARRHNPCGETSSYPRDCPVRAAAGDGRTQIP